MLVIKTFDLQSVSETVAGSLSVSLCPSALTQLSHLIDPLNRHWCYFSFAHFKCLVEDCYDRHIHCQKWNAVNYCTCTPLHSACPHSDSYVIEKVLLPESKILFSCRKRCLRHEMTPIKESWHHAAQPPKKAWTRIQSLQSSATKSKSTEKIQPSIQGLVSDKAIDSHW